MSCRGWQEDGDEAVPAPILPTDRKRGWTPKADRMSARRSFGCDGGGIARMRPLNLEASRSGRVGGNAGLNRRRRPQASRETWRRFPAFLFRRIEGRGEESLLGFRGAKRINLSGNSPSVLLRDIPPLSLRQRNSHRHPNSLCPLQCPSPHFQDTSAPSLTHVTDVMDVTGVPLSSMKRWMVSVMSGSSR